jgi:hypothetical protein
MTQAGCQRIHRATKVVNNSLDHAIVVGVVVVADRAAPQTANVMGQPGAPETLGKGFQQGQVAAIAASQATAEPMARNRTP